MLAATTQRLRKSRCSERFRVGKRFLVDAVSECWCHTIRSNAKQPLAPVNSALTVLSMRFLYLFSKQEMEQTGCCCLETCP